jgi:mitogen-activated protein kinase kinase kinase
MRRPGSGKGAGRIPPPLHLAQSNSVPASDLPQAWQPSATPGSSVRSGSSTQSNGAPLLGAPHGGITTSTSPRTAGSPRSMHPPALPPPSSRPPPAPTRRPSTSPPNQTISLPRTGAPGISTTAASPTTSWLGEYGLPRAPAPGNLAGGTFNLRTPSTSPSPADRIRPPPVGVAPARPSTGTAVQQQQHRKTGSGSNTPRPSTAQPIVSYGHNQPLSSHPYATTTSPTQEGFSSTTYGRASPNPSTSASSSLGSKLLPSPAIGQPVFCPVSDSSDGSRSAGSTSNGSLSTSRDAGGYSVDRGGFARPTAPSGVLAASGPVAGSVLNASSLDAVMRRAVKFIGDDGVSKMVAVADCRDGTEVLMRVLRKFQKLGAGAGSGGSGGEGDESEEWGVFSTSNDGSGAFSSPVSLSNADALADPLALSTPP